MEVFGPISTCSKLGFQSFSHFYCICALVDTHFFTARLWAEPEGTKITLHGWVSLALVPADSALLGGGDLCSGPSLPWLTLYWWQEWGPVATGSYSMLASGQDPASWSHGCICWRNGRHDRKGGAAAVGRMSCSASPWSAANKLHRA